MGGACADNTAHIAMPIANDAMLRFMSLLHVRHIQLERFTLFEREPFSELLDAFPKLRIPFLTGLHAMDGETHVLAGGIRPMLIEPLARGLALC